LLNGILQNNQRSAYFNKQLPNGILKQYKNKISLEPNTSAYAQRYKYSADNNSRFMRF